MTENLLEVLYLYDRQVRANNHPEDNAVLQAVATCHDGIMGAFGELLDLVGVHDGEAVPGGLAGTDDDIPLTDAEYDALHDLFLAWQKALRVELELDLKSGDRITSSGAGKTAGWGETAGRVTKVDSAAGLVYVQWDSAHGIEDEVTYAEVRRAEQVAAKKQVASVPKGLDQPWRVSLFAGHILSERRADIGWVELPEFTGRGDQVVGSVVEKAPQGSAFTHLSSRGQVVSVTREAFAQLVAECWAGKAPVR